MVTSLPLLSCGSREPVKENLDRKIVLSLSFCHFYTHLCVLTHCNSKKSEQNHFIYAWFFRYFYFLQVTKSIILYLTLCKVSIPLLKMLDAEPLFPLQFMNCETMYAIQSLLLYDYIYYSSYLLLWFSWFKIWHKVLFIKHGCILN